VQDWLGNTTSFAYDADGNPVTKTLPAASGLVDSAAFNAAEQLTEITDSQGTSTLFATGYGRDGNGQVTGDSSLPASVGSDRYNSLNQLCYAGSSASAGCSAPPSGSQVYAFDAADNLVSDEGTTQAFNAADQLCWTLKASSGNGCASPPSGATTYSYNARGDRTTITPPSGSATNLGYDQADRLTSWGQGSAMTATYSYNGDGLRMSKTVSGIRADFTWDVSGQLPLVLSDGSYNYVYGPGGSPLEQVSATALVGTASASGKASTLKLTLPAGVQPNDQVVVASTQPSSTRVTAPTGYTSVTSVTSGGSSPLASTTVFQHTIVSGDTSVTLSYGSSSTAQAAVLAVYRGVDPYQPVDVSAVGSAAAAKSVTAPSVAPSRGYDRLVLFQGAVGTFSGASWSAPAGLAERAQNTSTTNAAAGLADAGLTTAATGALTSSFGAAANLTAVAVTIAQPHVGILVGTGSGSGKSTSLKVNLPSGYKVNDQVLVASTQPSTTKVTAPSGYTLVATVTSGGASPLATTSVFRHTLASGDSSVTLSYSTSATAQSAVLALYRGADTVMPIDASASASAAGSTSVTAPAATVANAGDRLLIFQGAVGSFSSGAWTGPAGTIERAQVNSTANTSSGIADQSLASAGSTGSRVSTFSKSGNLNSVMVAITGPPSYEYFHADQLGSTRLLTDGAGNVRASLGYDPYGNQTAITGVSRTELTFAGYYRDDESGLFYLQARYYDAATAQFLSRDPAVGLTRSPYAYVGSNPLNSTDPSGLGPEEDLHDQGTAPVFPEGDVEADMWQKDLVGEMRNESSDSVDQGAQSTEEASSVAAYEAQQAETCVERSAQAEIRVKVGDQWQTIPPEQAPTSTGMLQVNPPPQYKDNFSGWRVILGILKLILKKGGSPTHAYRRYSLADHEECAAGVPSQGLSRTWGMAAWAATLRRSTGVVHAGRPQVLQSVRRHWSPRRQRARAARLVSDEAGSPR
jgi:RHS repeat-associated protein